MAASNKLLGIGVLAFIAFGTGMALYGYQQAIYPVDSALGYLSRAEQANTPEILASYVVQAKRELPESGNPVWAFPTARTDFGEIQAELDRISSRANSISSADPNSSDYNTGLLDMRMSIRALQEDLIEAMPYLYVSFTNVIFASVWIAVIMLIFVVMRRGRAKYREEYEK
jgi:hypothetical protein